MTIRSCIDLTRSKVKKGDLVLRVDNPNFAFLTVFSEFSHLAIKGQDFGANLSSKNTKMLGTIPTIQAEENYKGHTSATNKGKFYYGDKSKIADALVQEGFRGHAKILFPDYVR